MEHISDCDSLYRRLIWFSVQGKTVLAAAYYNRKGKPDPEISVNLARMSTPEETQSSGPPGFGVGVIIAKAPRDIGLGVRHAPLENNAAHALIEGASSKEHCRLLAEATEVRISPPPKE